jgi:hypothetical protein
VHNEVPLCDALSCNPPCLQKIDVKRAAGVAVTEFNASQNAIGQQGALYLSRLLNGKKVPTQFLQAVYLDQCQITDAGGAMLVRTLQRVRLLQHSSQTLSARWNMTTDQHPCSSATKHELDNVCGRGAIISTQAQLSKEPAW